MKTHINGNTIEQLMTNAVTLTQEQYDALPNEQKAHGTYIISDSVCPNISATNVAYSTGVSVKDKLDSISSKSYVTLTGGQTDGLAGLHIASNGIAYISGYFHTKMSLDATAVVGYLSPKIKSGNTSYWVGVITSTTTLVRGWVINDNQGNTKLCTGSAIPSGVDVVIVCMYETA